MKLFLDSHVILWAIYDPQRLTARVRTLLEEEENELFLSYASLQELFNKIARGGIPMAGTSVPHVLSRIENFGLTLLPVTLADIVSAATLPSHHRDPFDRIILAQAIATGLPILTADQEFSNYPVRVFWD